MDLKRMGDEKFVIVYAISVVGILVSIALFKNIDGVMFGAGMTAIGAVVGWYFKGKTKSVKGS